MVLLTNFQGMDSFTLDRNVIVNADDHDSLERTTDLSLDSREHNHNITSTEDDLDIHDDSSEINGHLMKRNIPTSLNQDHRHPGIHAQLFDFDSTEDLAVSIQTPDLSEEIQSTTIDDDLFEDSMELVTKQTWTEDANDNESLESYSFKDVALSTVPLFDHLPVIGVFSHPASDDLYIAKQYMGDYYLWGMGDDSAKEYFTQPAKGIQNFDSDLPLKVNAAQFGTFTPVRSLPNQRRKAVL